MYRARDRVDNEDWLDRIDAAGESLGVSEHARSSAGELFLTHIPDAERSKPAVAAASLYAGTLIAGEERSQREIADAMGVSRLSVQSRWKPLLEAAGFQPPTW